MNRTIFLVNPDEHAILENAGDRIPIGLISIASNLEHLGYRAEVIDLNHYSLGYLQQKMKEEMPLAVGISAYVSPVLNEAIKLSKIIPKGIKKIAGGFHASVMPETLTPYFDSVVVGEGEESMLEAITKSGIIRGEFPDLSRLDNLDYGFVNMDNYGIDDDGKRMGTIITSRGCPFNCSFCGNIAKKTRFEPVEKVRNQIRDLKRLGFNSIYFLDDIFTLKQDRMADILENINVPFRVTTRADLINEEKLDILKDNGCEIISMGIESGNDEILKKCRKGMTTHQNYEAVRLAGKRGIHTKGFFIIGLPGETEQSALDTINFSLRLKEVGLKYADFYFLSPFPGTPIFKDPESFGIKIKDKDYTKYLQAGKMAHCYIDTEELNSNRIEELVKEAKERWIKKI